jgi:hypothetical protein
VADGVDMEWIFPSDLPNLTTIRMHPRNQPVSINELAVTLFYNRHSLPALETVEYSSHDEPDDAALIMFAKMKLYKKGYQSVFSFFVAPPKSVLMEHPFLANVVDD